MSLEVFVAVADAYVSVYRCAWGPSLCLPIEEIVVVATETTATYSTPDTGS